MAVFLDGTRSRSSSRGVTSAPSVTIKSRSGGSSSKPVGGKVGDTYINGVKKGSGGSSSNSITITSEETAGSILQKAQENKLSIEQTKQLAEESQALSDIKQTRDYLYNETQKNIQKQATEQNKAYRVDLNNKDKGKQVLSKESMESLRNTPNEATRSTADLTPRSQPFEVVPQYAYDYAEKQGELWGVSTEYAFTLIKGEKSNTLGRKLGLASQQNKEKKKKAIIQYKEAETKTDKFKAGASAVGSAYLQGTTYFSESIVKDPVRSTVIFGLGGVVGFGASALVKGGVITASALSTAGHLATALYVPYVTVKTFQSEDKIQYLSGRVAEYTLFGAGAYTGAFARSSYYNIKDSYLTKKGLYKTKAEYGGQEWKLEPDTVKFNKEGFQVSTGKNVKLGETYKAGLKADPISKNVISGRQTQLKPKNYDYNIQPTNNLKTIDSTSYPTKLRSNEYTIEITKFKSQSGTIEILNKPNPITTPYKYSNELPLESYFTNTRIVTKDTCAVSFRYSEELGQKLLTYNPQPPSGDYIGKNIISKLFKSKTGGIGTTTQQITRGEQSGGFSDSWGSGELTKSFGNTGQLNPAVDNLGYTLGNRPDNFFILAGISDNINTNRIIIDTQSGSRTDTEIKQDNISSPSFDIISKNITLPKQDIQPIQDSQLLKENKSRTRQQQKQEQQQEEIIDKSPVFDIIQPINIIKIKQPKKEIEPPPILTFSIPKREPRQPKQQSFNILVRRERKFKSIGFTGSLRSAITKGVKRVSNTAGASFKITSGNKPITFSSNRLPYGQFRQSTKEKGVFIEKREKRIKSRGELAEITFKGLSIQRQRKKSGGFKWGL